MDHVKAHKEPQVPLRLIPKKLISHAENIYNDSKEKKIEQEMRHWLSLNCSIYTWR